MIKWLILPIALWVACVILCGLITLATIVKHRGFKHG